MSSSSETRSPDTVQDRGRPAYYQDPTVAGSYDRRYARGWQRWKHERKAALIRRWLAPATEVLEVACGEGRFHDTAPAGRLHIGVDLSREMLQRYAEKHADARLIVAAGDRLPFEDGAFHSVLCTRFVSHLRGEYRHAVLRELRRVARVQVILDGRHVYNLRFIFRWLRRRLRLAHADKLRTRYRRFREELAAAGLMVEEQRSIAWGLSARFLVRASLRTRS